MTGSETPLATLVGARYVFSSGATTLSSSWDAGKLPLLHLDPRAFAVLLLGVAVDSSDAIYAVVQTLRQSAIEVVEARLGVVKYSPTTGTFVWNQLEQETAFLYPSAPSESVALVFVPGSNQIVLLMGGAPEDATIRPKIRFLNPSTGALEQTQELSTLPAFRFSKVRVDSSGRFVVLGRPAEPTGLT